LSDPASGVNFMHQRPSSSRMSCLRSWQISDIVESLGNDLFKCRLKDQKEDSCAHIVLSEAQLNALGFAFSHMEELTRKLADEFYALFKEAHS
jgi:hypothetical protein